MKTRELPTSSPIEWINVYAVNEYISRGTVKIFYTGKNRNGSYISKPVGEQIAASLPGSPIVGLYNEDTEDFEDHARELVFKDGEVKITSKTIPYGFIGENANPIWKEFEDIDTGELRTYLVIDCYLWTGRFPELADVVKNNKGQSMEFFTESVKGDWARFNNDSEETFIISEAHIAGLCILGDTVEPAFEGSAFGTSEVMFTASHDDSFNKEFSQFVKMVKDALNPQEGGITDVKNKSVEVKTEFEAAKAVVVNAKAVDTKEVKVEEVVVEEVKTKAEEVVVEDAEVKYNALKKDFDLLVASSEKSSSDFTSIQSELDDLKTEYSVLEGKYNETVKASADFENSQKEELMVKFEMLGEEALGKIKEAFSSYSVESLEDKLSALAFKKGLSFSTTEKDEPIVTVKTSFSLAGDESAPAWLQAVEKNKK